MSQAGLRQGSGRAPRPEHHIPLSIKTVLDVLFKELALTRGSPLGVKGSRCKRVLTLSSFPHILLLRFLLLVPQRWTRLACHSGFHPETPVRVLVTGA